MLLSPTRYNVQWEPGLFCKHCVYFYIFNPLQIERGWMAEQVSILLKKKKKVRRVEILSGRQHNQFSLWHRDVSHDTKNLVALSSSTQFAKRLTWTFEVPLRPGISSHKHHWQYFRTASTSRSCDAFRWARAFVLPTLSHGCKWILKEADVTPKKTKKTKQLLSLESVYYLYSSLSLSLSLWHCSGHVISYSMLNGVSGVCNSFLIFLWKILCTKKTIKWL